MFITKVRKDITCYVNWLFPSLILLKASTPIDTSKLRNPSSSIGYGFEQHWPIVLTEEILVKLWGLYIWNEDMWLVETNTQGLKIFTIGFVWFDSMVYIFDHCMFVLTNERQDYNCVYNRSLKKYYLLCKLIVLLPYPFNNLNPFWYLQVT